MFRSSQAKRTASGRAETCTKVDASDACLEPIDGATINIVLCDVPVVDSPGNGTNDAENGNQVGVNISTVANTVGDAVTSPDVTDNVEVAQTVHAGDTNDVGEPKRVANDHSVANTKDGDDAK